MEEDNISKQLKAKMESLYQSFAGVILVFSVVVNMLNELDVLSKKELQEILESLTSQSKLSKETILFLKYFKRILDRDFLLLNKPQDDYPEWFQGVISGGLEHNQDHSKE